MFTELFELPDIAVVKIYVSILMGEKRILYGGLLDSFKED